MKTKLLISGILALAASLMPSCSEQDTVAGARVDGERTVTFNVSTDRQAQTRTAPAVSGYKLQYTIQVLDADGNPLKPAVSESNETGNFSVTLLVGAAYTCLFWADFIPDGGGANEYFTISDLRAVSLQKALTGDDQCQAFCGTANITADQAAATHDITLKRAVAQVNLKSMGKLEGYSKVEAAYANVPNTFNVLTGEVTTTGTGITPDFTVTDFSTQADDGNGNFAFHSAYFLAPGTEAANMVKITLNTYNNINPTTPLQTLTIDNVPTKKNYKTNVISSFSAAQTSHSYTMTFSEWADEISKQTVSVWDGTIPASADPGYTFGDANMDGSSEAKAYVIKSAANLAQLVKNVNEGTDYENKYFKMEIDIDLNNKPWTPIGIYDAYNSSDNRPFKGHFDGNKHKIINLYINTSTIQYVGLFGYTTYNSSISNLHITGRITNSVSGGCAGGFIGSGGSVIENCSFDGEVSCPSGRAGGFAGELNYAEPIASKNSGIISGRNAGGIVGSAWSTPITACYNEGSISASVYGGGIVGYYSDAGSEMKSCYNIGEVNDTSGNGSAAIGAMLGGDSGYPTYNCYVAKKYAVVSTNSNSNAVEVVFADGTWPTDTDEWKTTTSGGYWKDLGGWNNGNPVYPKLRWEE